METKHSGLGIASFVISLVMGIAMAVLFGFSVVLAAKHGDKLDENSGVAVLLGLGIIGAAFLLLVGLALGIAGLFQKERRKLFAILGTVFNGLILLGAGGLVLLGMAMGG